jgi:hypothetical protein
MEAYQDKNYVHEGIKRIIIIQRPDDGGSMYLWNISLLQRDH